MHRTLVTIAATLALATAAASVASKEELSDRIKWAACGYELVASKLYSYCYVTRLVRPSDDLIYLSPQEFRISFLPKEQTPASGYRVALMTAKIRNNIAGRDLTDLSLDIRLIGTDSPIDAVAYSTGVPRIAPHQQGEMMFQLVTSEFEGDGVQLGSRAIINPKLATFYPHVLD